MKIGVIDLRNIPSTDKSNT